MQVLILLDGPNDLCQQEDIGTLSLSHVNHYSLLSLSISLLRPSRSQVLTRLMGGREDGQKKAYKISFGEEEGGKEGKSVLSLALLPLLAAAKPTAQGIESVVVLLGTFRCCFPSNVHSGEV